MSGKIYVYSHPYRSSIKVKLFFTRLEGNSFHDEDACYWAEAIEENKYCKQLNLSGNNFGDDGAELLGPAIASNDILEELDLSWNQIRQDGGVAIAKGLKVVLQFCFAVL